jgi:atypical dual specificity phosphatase
MCPDGEEHFVTFLWTYTLMCIAVFRMLRRKSSARGPTPPESPRMLPPTPSTIHSSSTLVRRPRSGPAGLHSYTGSAPPSRSGSRLDVTELPPGVMNWQDRRAGSAPTTPMASPPASPRHWSRRASTLVRKRSNT